MSQFTNNDAQFLLKQAAATIRSLITERDSFKAKIAQSEEETRIRKIASDMEAKSLNPDLTFEEKVASLRQTQDLNVVEEAVKIASPQGFGLGELGDVPSQSDAASALNTFIMSGE